VKQKNRGWGWAKADSRQELGRKPVGGEINYMNFVEHTNLFFQNHERHRRR
jgi:hypothetical protein